jgi:hypothetical protein
MDAAGGQLGTQIRFQPQPIGLHIRTNRHPGPADRAYMEGLE